MKDEEMAKEYAEEKVSNLDECRTKDLMRSVCKDGFLAGLKAGRPKWHYVKDELPELYKDVLVVFPRGDCDVKRLTNHNEWVGRGSWCSLTDVIAWKEIVLPELKESE